MILRFGHFPRSEGTAGPGPPLQSRTQIIKIQLPSEYRTPKIQKFDFSDTFLSGFQMVSSRECADHSNTGHFRP